MKYPQTPYRPALIALGLLLLAGTGLAGPPRYPITTGVVCSGSTVADCGAVVLDPARADYQKNNVVIVTAVPAGDWRFDHWEGDLGGTDNPTTLRVSGAHTVTAVFTDGLPPPPPPPPGVDRPPLPTERMIVGYFAQWTIYRRDYLVRDVEASGAAGALNVINYAFAAPDENLRCASLDTFADYGKRFDAGESVDGVADTVAQPLKGNFNQLLKLKAMHPHLRVLLSLGGWTQSFRFSDAALEENREAFVDSCIDMFIRGNVAPGVSAAGVFDGLDIDWEYPGSCGETCDFRPEDRENFVALLELFRAKLDALEDEVEQVTGTRPEYLLTIAAPAGQAQYDPIDLAGIHGPLDWINVMTYDFHGGWESSGPANHQAPIYRSPCDATDADWSDKALQAYLGAGVPPSKLLLGVPFYGRGWRGVASVNDGLCQSAGGVPRGTYEKGVDDFEVLDADGHPDFWDEATATHWTYNGSEFWSYDDERSLGWKADYANGLRPPDGATRPTLRGVLFWELSGDAPDGRLLRSLRESLGTASAH